MTKSTITREENILAVFDLKAGYTLGLADVEILKRVARMALAAMDSEPVFTLQVSQADYKGQKLGNHFGFITLDAARELKEGDYPLYLHAQLSVVESEPVAEVLSNRSGNDTSTIDRALPVGTQLYRHAQQPVVPEEWTIADAVKFCKETGRQDAGSAMDAWNACRAAMLQELQKSAGAEATCRSNENVQAVEVQSLTSINPAPDLVSLQKKAESIIGNYPGIPDCWCRTCCPVVLNDMRFVVCPDCGNKRCPRANDHRNACTGSNEPGQEGGAYPDTPQEVKP